jgi:hypothetical protein
MMMHIDDIRGHRGCCEDMHRRVFYAPLVPSGFILMPKIPGRNHENGDIKIGMAESVFHNDDDSSCG